MTIRFVHAADLHLDSPFQGLASSAPERVSKTLRDATFQAFDAIIELCITENVDALLVAGDIYDGADRSLRAQRKFVAGLTRLHEAGIRSFVCHGNHDPLSGWEAGLSLPESCHRFGADVTSAPFDPADPARGMVYGMSYPRQTVRENIARRFKREEHGGLAIGLLHCNVGGNTAHESYAPCSIDDLVGAGMDYWALGHVHTRHELRPQSPAIIYPGNPQGRHPNETGARGAYLVTIDDAARVTAEFRALDVVRWARLSVSIEGRDGIEDLMTAMDIATRDALDAADGRHLVYRLVLTGQGDLHHELQRPGEIDELTAQRNEGLGWPFAWCARIEDATRPAFDRRQALEAGDFLSEVLKAVDAASGASAEQAALIEELGGFYAHMGVKRFLKDGIPEPGDIQSLLQDAEGLCAELLGGEVAR